jgi:polysaccharide biosynthesis protein PslG
MAALALLALLLVPAPAQAMDPVSSRDVPGGLGVNIHFVEPDPIQISRIREAGFRWVRTDFVWALTETSKGQYNFAAYDRLVSALRKVDLKILFILDYANPLYDAGQAPHSAEAQEAFASWALAAAQHFRGQGVVWELYNEPNLDHFWKPRSDAQAYARLALAVARKQRSAEVDATFIGPATARIDFDFLSSCFRAGVLRDWAAVSVHPYRETDPETVVAEYARLRQLIDRYKPRDREIPIVVSEWGYSDSWKASNPTRQGALLAREWLVNLSEDIRISIWYDWRDDGTDPKNHEHHFGVVQAAGAPASTWSKPAFRAAQTLMTTLAGFRFSRRITTGNADDWILEFTNGTSRALAAWTTGSAHPVLFPSTGDNIAVRTSDGELHPAASSADRQVRLTLTSSPIYVIPGAPSPAVHR